MMVSITDRDGGLGVVRGPSDRFCLGHTKHGYMVPDPGLSSDSGNAASSIGRGGVGMATAGERRVG